MEPIFNRFLSIPASVTRNQFVRQYFKKTEIKFSKEKGPTKPPFNKTKRPVRAMTQNDAQELQIDSLVENMSSFRRWEPFAAKPEESALGPGLTFKLISYNILAQDLLVEYIHLYRHCNPEHLKWSYRAAKLAEEINSQKPDIVCLQEVQDTHLNEIESRLKKAKPMSSLFKKKTGFKGDGCAVLYNNSLFEVAESHSVEYFQPGCMFLDRHNIALIAKFRCKSKPQITFLVCTTHMLYNPRREDIRLAQTVLLLAELDRHSLVTNGNIDDLQRIPIILTGDFNFTPYSAPFELITTGVLQYEYLSRNALRFRDGGSQLVGKFFLSPNLGITDSCQHIDFIKSNYKDRTSNRLFKQDKSQDSDKAPPAVIAPELFSTGTFTHNLNLKSVYNHFDSKYYGSTFQTRWITVDHMFYSGSSSLRPLSVLQLPTGQDCAKVRFLPNGELGSDHLMLAAELRLTFPPEEP